jgi:hypothetical protein
MVPRVQVSQFLTTFIQFQVRRRNPRPDIARDFAAETAGSRIGNRATQQSHRHR